MMETKNFPQTDIVIHAIVRSFHAHAKPGTRHPELGGIDKSDLTPFAFLPFAFLTPFAFLLLS
jgi:hypothetical protein